MSNNPETPPGLLHETYQDLQKSGEVEWAVQRESEPVPNNPHQRVATYLGSLVGRHGLLGGSEGRRQAQVAHHVMDPEDIPESYFDRQREIARQQGHGDIEINDEMRRQHSEALIADQTASLNAWAEYLNNPDADYPAWFRYYTMRNVLKLADYDKEKERFRKRSNKTTAPYPELNREALAYVYDSLNRRLKGQQQNDEQIQELAQQANFNKLYSHALAECVPSDQEQLQTTAGEWTTYQQLDPEEGTDRANQLAQSLQGYGTGWCTAGESTARRHLESGDFHVYYSYDQEGQPTVPRVAVRMQNGKVAEVRGIETGENLEPAMTDIAMECVKDLPGGEQYFQVAENMNRVTDIETRVRQGQEMIPRDIYFLREYGGDIQSFGYGKDPRIDELLQDRDPSADMDKMMEEFDHTQLARNLLEFGPRGQKTLVDHLDKFLQSEAIDHAELARDLMRHSMYGTLADNLDKFLQSEVDHTQLASVIRNNGGQHILACNLDKFPPEAVDHAQFAQDLMNSGFLGREALVENLDKFPPKAVDYAKLAQDYMDSGMKCSIAENLDKFPDGTVDHAELARYLMIIDADSILAENLDKFPPEAVNHTKLAHRLMNRGVYNVEVLARNLDKFPPEAVDHAELVRDMMDRGWESMSTLVANLDKFPDGTVDHAEIVRDLMNKGWEHILAQNLDKFPPEAVDQFQLARDLLKSSPRGRKILAENLDKFQFMAVDQAQLVRDLMRSGMEHTLAENLDKFPEGAIDHARELMDSRGEHSLARNLDKLRDASAEVRDQGNA
jgi:hypothetical protein